MNILTVKKQLTAFGLLLLVALPLVLSVCMFINQKMLQHQRQERFETEQVQTIVIAAEKLTWVKAEKEVLINGRLFDVESIKKVGQTLELTGFFDHREDKLVKHINTVEQQKNNSNSLLNQFAFNFLFLPNYKETITFSVQNNWQLIASRFPFYTESLSSMAYPAIAPPPKHG
jgi:hypothetical protein